MGISEIRGSRGGNATGLEQTLAEVLTQFHSFSREEAGRRAKIISAVNAPDRSVGCNPERRCTMMLPPITAEDSLYLSVGSRVKTGQEETCAPP